MATPRTQAVAATPLRRPAPAPRRTPLRVVAPDPRLRAVGRLGSIFALTVFALLLFLAVVHAALVQTQARIDAQRNANLQTIEEIAAIEAEVAWIESPAGVEEWAEAAGLVRAPGVAVLARVQPGQLAPPSSPDPFRQDPVVVDG